jgi:hypothetical protein
VAERFLVTLQNALEVDGQHNGQGNKCDNYHVEDDMPLE